MTQKIAHHIIFTVTNTLVYDQRMFRICQSLASNGYAVTLVGVALPDAPPLPERVYRQIRVPVTHTQGKLFYLQYNYRLLKLLPTLINNRLESTTLCAIDLDTLLAVYLVASKLGIQKVYDAHELFTELTEVRRRPLIWQVWKMLESWLVPKFNLGYTVNQFLADEFNRRYRVRYEVIRNMPLQKHYTSARPSAVASSLPEKYFLYQGAVNEGRAFDTLIPAMAAAPLPLVIVGNGNYFHAVQQLVNKLALHEKVILLGYVAPHELVTITQKAFAGLTLFDNTGLNQYQSLANRFFDYVQAHIPQICVNYPEYKKLNQVYEVAILVPDVEISTLEKAMHEIWLNKQHYEELKNATLMASNRWVWEVEEQKLLNFWQKTVSL